MKLGDVPGAVDLASQAIFLVAGGRFDQLVETGSAGPSSAEEYQRAFERAMTSGKLDSCDRSLESAEVCELRKSGEYRVEIDLMSEDRSSEATAIFYLSTEGGIARRLRLYDIRVL